MVTKRMRKDLRPYSIPGDIIALHAVPLNINSKVVHAEILLIWEGDMKDHSQQTLAEPIAGAAASQNLANSDGLYGYVSPSATHAPSW